MGEIDVLLHISLAHHAIFLSFLPYLSNEKYDWQPFSPPPTAPPPTAPPPTAPPPAAELGRRMFLEVVSPPFLPPTSYVGGAAADASSGSSKDSSPCVDPPTSDASLTDTPSYALLKAAHRYEYTKTQETVEAMKLSASHDSPPFFQSPRVMSLSPAIPAEEAFRLQTERKAPRSTLLSSRKAAGRPMAESARKHRVSQQLFKPAEQDEEYRK